MALDTNYIERLTLLSNASATGSYVAVKGGEYIWAAEATFASGTLQLQAKNANGTATDISGATLTAAGFVSVLIAANSEVRVSITGSPTAIYSTLTAVP
jgi:hypothetical protein